MNFMERLEEGLGEDSSNITKHMRVSTYQRKNQPGEENPSESLLMDDDSTDIATSTACGGDSGPASQASSDARVPGYEGIEDSYFNHAATVDQPPVQARPLETYQNSIYENFFGSNITVTKLLNKETNEEKVKSKH